MSHRDNKNGNPIQEIKKYVNPTRAAIKQENNQMKMANQSIPTKQTNTHRSCLKHRQTNTPSDNDESSRLSTGRVSFAHVSSNDGKILIPSQSQIDLVEKKRRSALFAKKAKELQLAELNYFKDHARDNEPTDEEK